MRADSVQSEKASSDVQLKLLKRWRCTITYNVYNLSYYLYNIVQVFEFVSGLRLFCSNSKKGTGA